MFNSKSFYLIGKFSFLIFLIFLFISCDNSLSAELFRETLQKEVEYVNAQEIEILVAPDLNQGTTIPSGTYKKKAGFEFEISFTEAENYQFDHWIAVNSSTGEQYSDKVVFENASSTSTKVTVNEKLEKLWIKPVCYVRPVVERNLPEMTEEGVSRDSSIVIFFNKPLSSENDFSKIEITSAGEDVSINFKNPILNENLLTFPVDKKNLVNVESGKTKSVSVKLPDNLFYMENERKVFMGKETLFTYKVNSTTSNKAELIFTDGGETGTVSPSGTQNYNIGETFELNFIPKTGYTFTGWKILDSEGNTVSDDVLKIENRASMKTIVTVLKDERGISVIPENVLLPGVINHRPEASTIAIDANTPISVDFNMPVKAEDINFSNIYILNGGENITQYFDEPVLSNEGKTVTINPIALKLVSFIKEKNAAFIDVKVMFTNGIKAISDEKEYSLLQNEKSEWTFRYKPDTEKIAPAKYALEISKTLPVGEAVPAVAETNLISKKSLSELNETEILTNWVADSIYITGRFYDADSGVENVIIEETLVTDLDGKELKKDTDSYDAISTYTVSSPSDKLNIIFDENGYATFGFVYKIKTVKDGGICLNIRVADKCGNINQGDKVYVINSLSFDWSGIEPCNYKNIPDVGKRWHFDKDYYELHKNEISVEKKNTRKRVYKNVYCDTSIECKYFDRNKNPVRSEMLSNLENNELSYSFDVETIDELDFTLYVTDKNKNEFSKQYSFPGKSFISFTIVSDAVKEFYWGSKGHNTQIFMWMNFEDGYDITNLVTPYAQYNKNEEIDKFWMLSRNGLLFGEFSDISYDNTYDNPIGSQVTDLTFSNLSFESCGPNTDQININMEIPESLWEKYDGIYVENKSTSYYETTRTSFKYKSTVAQTKAQTAYLYNAPEELTLFGIDKEGIVHKGFVIEYPPALKDLENSLSYYNRSPNTKDEYTLYEEVKALGGDIFPLAYFISPIDYGVSPDKVVNPIVNFEWWTDEFPTVRTDEISRRTFKYLSKSGKTPVEKEITKDCVSIVDMDENNGNLYLKGTDKAGNYSIYKYNYRFLPELKYKLKCKEPYIENKKRFVRADVYTEIEKEQEPKKYSEKHLVIQSLDSKTNLWTDEKDIELEKDILAVTEVQEMPYNAWIRYKTEYNGLVPDESQPAKTTFNISDYTYCYTGGESTYNEMLREIGNTVYFRSDKSAFVHTLITLKPYSECKSWTAAQWEHHRKTLNERVLSLSGGETGNAKGYTFNMTEIPEGYCYVAVIHFANGEVKMTEVKQK
ncbi:MAG: Ig-like domain-containing protein [Treponema sp.]|nr:Ig-like domain-containing protein [Treponema sp.]